MYYAYNFKTGTYLYGSENKIAVQECLAINFPNSSDWGIVETDSAFVCPVTAQDKSLKIRQKRNDMLVRSDWTQLPDNTLDANKKAEWAAYRQSLRDITLQSDFPNSATFPSQPV